MNAQPEVADTYGWDTAFAIRIDDVNAAIRNKKSSPTAFQAEGTDPLSKTQFTANGTFGDWQICLGGSGTLIHMLTPVPSMTVTSGPNSWPFENGGAVIEVELEYVPHADPPAGTTSGTFQDLMVKTGGDGLEADNVVSVLSFAFNDSSWADFEPALSDALQSWFNQHLVDFEHVFATVNLGRMADQGQFQWLLPTYTSYAYIDRDSQDDSLLGILSMTAGRDPTGLVDEISANAIPSGSRAGFLMSQERFLVEMLLPSMPLVFQGSSVGDYSLSADARSIVLNNPVQLQAVQHDGNTYSPELQSMTITANGQEVTVDSTTKVEVSWEIWSYCHSTYSYAIVLTPQASGKQTLDFQQLGTPVQENWTEKSEGVQITEIIAGIIAALAVVVLGVLTDGAGFVIGALVIGLLVGVANQIPNLIATVGTDDAPPIDLLVFNATDPLVWSDQKDFSLTDAGLNQSLQLGGIPLFVGPGDMPLTLGNVAPTRSTTAVTPPRTDPSATELGEASS